MNVGAYITSSLENRIHQKILSNMSMQQNPLSTVKKALMEVAVENIILSQNQDDLVEDFGFLLDHLEKCTDLTLISKVKMYNTYIQTMTQFFNLNAGRNGKTIECKTVPNFTYMGQEFQLVEEKNRIIFTHGYDATHSGKEAAIALFQYIDSNFIKKKAPYKVKDKG